MSLTKDQKQEIVEKFARHDGDTGSQDRRNLRDNASVIVTNPDMLHAALLPQHGRWARFLSGLRYVVLDEVHVFTGMFGANVANLMRRFWRAAAHYRVSPTVVACSGR